MGFAGDVVIVGHEIVAVHVVDISVAVVIAARSAVELGLVDPKVGLDVGMGDIHSAVHYSHDYVFIAEDPVGVPGFLELDVHSCGESVLAGVVVVPLGRILGIVHGHRSLPDFQRRFGELYAFDLREVSGGAGQRDILIVADGEPFVETGRSLAGFEFSADKEGRAH